MDKLLIIAGVNSLGYCRGKYVNGQASDNCRGLLTDLVLAEM